MAQFKGRSIIVTGAGTGVGRETAISFVKEGANVTFVGRRTSMLEEASANLPKEQVLLLTCDVSDRSSVDKMIAQVIERFGSVDILVNNAGINTSPRALAEVSLSDWQSIVDINLTGCFNTIQSVLPEMRKKKDGLIINISSIAGLRGGKLSGAAYSASKHGLNALNHTLNEEEKDYGIRACAICPGEIDTPIIDKRPEPISPEHRARILKPEDVSAAVLFVASLPARACVPELVIKPTTQIFK